MGGPINRKEIKDVKTIAKSEGIEEAKADKSSKIKGSQEGVENERKKGYYKEED